LIANEALKVTYLAAQANAVAQVKTAETDLTAKTAAQKTADLVATKSTDAEKEAAKFGVTEATTHHTNMVAAQTTADKNVTDVEADIKENNARIAWGVTWAKDTNNTGNHQVTWMNSRIAGQNDLASAKAVQAANVAAEATEKVAALKTILTAQVAGGKTEIALAANLVKWNKYTVDHSTLAEATAIQKKNEAACTKVAKSAPCSMAADDAAAVKSLTAAAAEVTAADDKADAAVKAADHTPKKEAKNEDYARAELARLVQAEQDAAWAVTECTMDCDHLKTVEANAKAAVTTQKAYLADASNFTHSSDAATAIIIICVSAFVCITGGCLWTHHEKKKQAAKDAEHAKVEAGEAVPTMDADAAVNFNDDAYTAMVDCEM
jgi:hypothetical protein